MRIVTATITLILSTTCFANLDIATEELNTQGYVDIKVENVVINTDRIAIAAETLSASIDQLSKSIEKLATEGTAFEPEDRAALLAATNSVDQASQSLTELARQIPLTAQQLSNSLPEALSNSRQSLSQISSSIGSANQALSQITDSFPETLEQGENLVDRLLDSALQKVTFYAFIILFLLLLTFGALIYYSYRTVVQPLISLLQEFKAIPEQMSEMSKQMKQTSENLLMLQPPSKDNSQSGK
jgi:hypothetical protein